MKTERDNAVSPEAAVPHNVLWVNLWLLMPIFVCVCVFLSAFFQGEYGQSLNKTCFLMLQGLDHFTT